MGKIHRVELIPAQRRALVLEHIRLKGSASILELAAGIGASASTIRRDLEELERKGYLERSHGGALLQRTTSPTRGGDRRSILSGREKRNRGRCRSYDPAGRGCHLRQ